MSALSAASVLQEAPSGIESLDEHLAARVMGMARACAESEAFVSLLAHELRGRLAVIERTLTDGDADVETAIDQTRAVRRLADDLLELARGTGGDAGGGGDASEAIALVVDEIARDPQWADADIRVQPLPSVDLPQSLLVTVLRNLVRNALEAGARRIDVFARPDGTICVRDDGPGISAAEAIRVFGVYSGKPGGAGVGLSLCRDLLRRRGGEIWLERPSTFAFRVG